jgi:two-component system sensor histidine kinase KdpD
VLRRWLSWLILHGYVLAILAIALSTVLFLPGRATFAKGQWALLYLLIVVLVAGASGTGPAILAAILGFLAWNFFFLPPYHTFVIRDPKDWLSLVVFLAVGIVMGVQTGRMRDREVRAVAREQETAALNRLTAGLVSESSTEKMAEGVLGEIIDLLGAASATLFVADGGLLQSFCAVPPCELPDPATAGAAEWVYEHDAPLGIPARGPQSVGAESESSAGGGSGDDHVAGSQTLTENGDDRPPAAGGQVLLPLRRASGVAGVLGVDARTDGRPYEKEDARLLASLANLIAIFLERQDLEAAASAAEAEREADRLKSSLLSSVSHELKTPLAALTATVSNLLESDIPWNEKSVRDELRAIVSDVTRLNNSISALLDLSRLEAHAWEPRREPYELSDIVAASLDSLPAHERARIVVSLPDELPSIDVDFEQWVRVFQNLLENAVVYARGVAPVRAGASRSDDGGVEMWVEDEGPGIPAHEHEAVFEKFYRGLQTGTRARSGTGFGLAIAREIVRAHGGHIYIEDVQPHGARFVIALPPSGGEEGT